MSKNKRMSQQDLTRALQVKGPEPARPIERLSAPTTEMSLSLTLDQLRPYDGNPRTLRNPRYDELKESIRQVGLKQRFSVTQRPGDDRYMISDGGNTRLAILRELYDETGDARFFSQDCHFTPWQGEINVLAGHLAENNTRGHLTWIENCRGVYQAKQLLEQEQGREISQRSLADILRNMGFSLPQSRISRMLYTMEHFLATFPLALDSGMGRPQIEKLVALRNLSEEFWLRCVAFWQDAKDISDDGQSIRNRLLSSSFADAWHETMSVFDVEGLTQLDQEAVERDLKGMLNDYTGVHYNIIDLTWLNWFYVREGGIQVTQDDREQVWRSLDAELDDMRAPGHSVEFPSLEEERKRPPAKKPTPTLPSEPTNDTPSLSTTSHEELSPEETVENTPSLDTVSAAAPNADAQAQQAEIARLKAELENTRAQLDESQSWSSETLSDAAQDESDEGFMEAMASDNIDDDDRSQRLASLSLSPSHESEGHRQLRHMQAAEYGEEAIDFEAAALKAIPLEDGDSIAPITDIWHVPVWNQKAMGLRIMIGKCVQVLGQWADVEVTAHSSAIRLTPREGLGFSLEPFDDMPNRRAQLIWQLLAGLTDTLDPGLPSELNLLGELMGTHGDDNCRMPDGVLIRLWRLIRLTRVLKDITEEAPINPDADEIEGE
ncbi:ParB family protein [Carnimonas bestiolae]|uniref:ParB family protein n=1 Tax=Carnimonas bestiolae TaxID=3402172 RepID=UPI003EDC85D2